MNKTNDTQNATPEVAPAADNKPVTDDAKPDVKVVKTTTKDKAKTTTVKNIAPGAAKTFTIKRANDSSVLYQGDSTVTLGELDKIFGTSFASGQLVLTIDGEVVFNGTVNGDLASVIFDIIEKFLGEHNIKVEFTDDANNTNTFEENVIIE